MSNLICIANYNSIFDIMKNDWQEKAANDPEYALKRPYAKQALLTNCWIYSDIQKRWYTPEEFMSSQVGIRAAKRKDNADMFRILDPFIAHQKQLDIAKLQNDFNDAFYRKMVEYFEIKRKGAKNGRV